MSRLSIASAAALLGLLAAAIAASALLAQQAGSEGVAPKYRRIFVLQDELQSQVKGLLPVKREEFQRRLSAANNTQADAAAGPRITRAQYDARLDGHDLVAGEARWEVAATDGANRPGARLSLEPCNLALGQGQWEETPPRRAMLGIGPRNVLSLAVDKPGAVLFPWTHRGQEIGEGAVQFDLQFPAASLAQMRLRLPDHLRLTAEPGLVFRTDKRAGEADGQAEWLVELGGMGRVKLRVYGGAAANPTGDLMLVKEQTRYALMPTDVSAEFQFQLDVHGQALTAAQLQVDPRLKVTGVSVRTQPAAWSVAGDEKVHTLSIEFPEPLQSGNQTVTVQAACDLTPGRPWRLPRIIWQGAVWQEGSATLSVPSSMQVAVISASACRATQGVPPAAGGESIGFQYHAADGYVEIETLPRQPRLTAAVGVAVQFDTTTQVSATLRAVVTSQEGEAFEIDAVVSNEWILDSLETEPPDLLEDRPIVIQDDRTRTMRLKFQRPITPQSPMRLVVRARRQQPDASDLSSETLWRWFRLKGAIERPAVLALRSNIANFDLQVAGDVDAVRLDPEASSIEELDLLDASPAGLLFRLPPEASDFQVLLREGEPRYTATWDLTAACSRSRLRHDVTVRCVPSGPGLSRLKLSATPPPNREIRWRVTGIPDATVVAQTRRDTGASSDNSAAEAVWELELSRPLAQPFALETTWETPRAPRQTVTLFSCLEATTQSCIVRVTAEDDARWWLAASGLTAMPIPSEDPGRFTRTRGLFRYEPGQRPSLAVADASDETLVPPARVRRAELTSRFAADGSALCVLSLKLENMGLTELPLRLPLALALQEVAVDGRPIDPLLAGSQPGNLRIPLPLGVRNVAVQVSYAAAAQPRPRYVRTWQTELPELTLPAPSLTWHVALPPGIRAIDDVGSAGWHDPWRARFWGPFFDGQPWTRWLHPWRTIRPPPPASGLAGKEEEEESGADESSEKALNPGWVLLSRRQPWSRALALEVYDPHRSALFGLVLALLSAGLVLTAPRRWLTAWFFVGSALAAAVLLAPLAASPLLAGAFWGVVAGCISGLLRPAAVRIPAHQPSRASTLRWLAGASGSAFLLLAWLLWSGAAPLRAQPPQGGFKSESAKATTHRVVIPIDDDRKPVGDYVFVDDALYDYLFRQPQHGQPGEPWQVAAAGYEIRWPNLETAGTPAADLRAALEIETFAADVLVTLPFRREDLVLQQGGARLDGMPLAVSWQEDGRGLMATIPSPGKYRLDLAFSAPLKEAGQQRELALAIPRAPHAIARIHTGSGTAPWVAASALGSSSAIAEAAGASWQIDLGAAAELSLRPASTGSSGNQQAVEAEQLLWWKVRPGSVVVDAMCKFRPLTGSLREVQVRFDPRLRLLPLDGLPQGARHWVETGTISTLHVALGEPSDEVVIRPRFLLAESSGIGKIVPPRLEAVAGRISRHWMAVTTGPGLELAAVQQPSTGVAPVDFAQALGVVDALPQAAFDLAAGEALRELEFRPEMRRASASTETTVFCGLRLCRLRFQAELTDLAPQHVQQRVALPPGWTATNVVVRDGDLPLASRWFQQADGAVVVRLDQPPGNSQQLQVDATSTPPAGATLALPAVQLLEASDAGQTLRVVRSHDCALQITEAVGWTADDQGLLGRHFEGLGRLAASLRGLAGADRRQLTMQITPNRPQVFSRLVTRYARPTSPGAEVVVVCDLEITGGTLDALRLEAPPEWAGPWETSPPLSVRTAVVPGQARRHVMLIPELPLTGKVQLTLKSPLRPTGGEPLRVPEIALVDLPQVERLVQLPKATEGERASWRIAGLQTAPLPPDLRAGLLADGDYETLAVVAPHFDAVLAPVSAARLAPLVWLAEYRTDWQPPGVVLGTATFCLDLAGLDACSIDFPDGYRPTFVMLDGIPAQVAHEQEGRWRIRLPGERLPQRLAIGFLGFPQPVAGKLLLAGPTLAGLPAQATIWSLSAPDSLSATSQLSGEGELVRLDQDLLRLTSTEELLKRAARRDVTGYSSDALATWLRPWRIDAAAASHRARTALKTLVADDGQRQERFRQVQASLAEHWQVLPAGQPLPEITANSSAQDAGDHRRFGGAIPGHQPQVELSLLDSAASEFGRRSGAAIAVLLLGTLAWLLTRWSAVGDWLAVSGPFLLAVGGIALACLSPLGLAALTITLIAVAIAWRPPWSRIAGEHRSSLWPSRSHPAA